MTKLAVGNMAMFGALMAMQLKDRNENLYGFEFRLPTMKYNQMPKPKGQNRAEIRRQNKINKKVNT